MLLSQAVLQGIFRWDGGVINRGRCGVWTRGIPSLRPGGTLTQRAASVVGSFVALAEGREEGVLLCTGLWRFPSRFPFPYS